MDFLDPGKKKKHSVKLFIGYALMAVVIGLSSWLLLLIGSGYYYNRRTGQVIQNGLIFLRSRPVSADVYVNGENNGNTSTKLALPAGDYSIELKSAGYRKWSNKLNLGGGSVEQLIYPLLFPNKLITSDINTYAKTPSIASQSPDQRWLLVLPSGQIDTLDEYDLKSITNPVSQLTLPSNILKKNVTNQSLVVVDWADDNRHLLLKHSFKGGSEFIVFDRADPSSSFNINQLFDTNPSQVALRDKSSNRLYFYSSKTKQVSTADVNSQTVTPILSKVMNFKSFGSNQIVYLTDDGKAKNQIAVKLWDGSKSYHVHYYPAKRNYYLDLNNFRGSDYLAIGQSNPGTLYIYKNPLAQAKRTTTAEPFRSLKLKQINFQSVSEDGRFLAIQNGQQFGIYDIDTDRRHYFTFAKITPTTQAKWMDGYHLVSTGENKTLVIDFDGTNQQILSASRRGFNAYFSPDFTRLYNISTSLKSSKQLAISKTELTID